MQSVYHVRILFTQSWHDKTDAIDAIDAIRVPRAQISFTEINTWGFLLDAIRVPRAQRMDLYGRDCISDCRCNPCTTCMRFASIAWHKKSRTYGAWLSCVAGKSAIAI